MTYAIIGASNNKEKYGYKITLNLKERGFDITPINPHENLILDLTTYKSILDVPKTIEMAIFIVPPQISLKILNEVKKLNIKKTWFQPGSESDEVIEFCKENNIEYVANSCIMINTNMKIYENI